MKANSKIRRSTCHPQEHGYILLTLLLVMATMAIFAAMIVPSIKFEMQRDREEEMIHRGVQYSRAIRAYYKKFGRYPVKIEDLESSNNLRFLRKRYKDPMSCKAGKCADFKLLHFGEVQMSLSGMGGGTIPGASPIGGNTGLNGMNGPGGFSQPSTFGGNSSFGSSSLGTGPNSSVGQNPQTGTNSSAITPDTSQPGSQTSPDASGNDSSSTRFNGTGIERLGSGQVIGGPIVGVASTSKDATIREFNHKKKYKDWAFVYDPAQDGRLITTPYQPQLPGIGQQPNLNGATGINGQPGNNGGFGNSSGFGNNSGFGSSSSGFGNNPNPPSSQPNPPSNPPQQQ